MKATKILYIDRQGVSLTRFTLKIKKHSYPVKTMSVRPVELKAKKFPGLLLLTVGLVLSTSGYLDAASIVGPFNMPVALYSGSFIAAVGVLAFFLTRKRYALQITTSTGVKNILIRSNKEYILNLIHKLDMAFIEAHTMRKFERQQVA